MSRFPTAGAPGRVVRRVPRKSRVRREAPPGGRHAGQPVAAPDLIESARAAARTKDSYFGAQYRQIARRRGPNKAAVAVAHSLLDVIWHMLTTGEVFADLGADFFTSRPTRSTRPCTWSASWRNSATPCNSAPSPRVGHGQQTLCQGFRPGTLAARAHARAYFTPGGAPAVLPHNDELARQAADQPRRGHQQHRGDHHPHRPDRAGAPGRRHLPHRSQGQQRADGRPAGQPPPLPRRLELHPPPRLRAHRRAASRQRPGPSPRGAPRADRAGPRRPGPADRPAGRPAARPARAAGAQPSRQ